MIAFAACVCGLARPTRVYVECAEPTNYTEQVMAEVIDSTTPSLPWFGLVNRGEVWEELLVWRQIAEGLVIALTTNHDNDEYVWVLAKLATGDLRLCRGDAGRGDRRTPFGFYADADVNWVTNLDDDLQFKPSASDRLDLVSQAAELKRRVDASGCRPTAVFTPGTANPMPVLCLLGAMPAAGPFLRPGPSARRVAA